MKICFVAQHIYPHLSKSSTTQTSGGAELQQTFIGRGLRDRGYDVSYISIDYGQVDGEIINGLKIYKSFKPKEGVYGVRFFYPRLYKIWKALRKANADIYYARCATFLPGILAIFCQINKKKFVYGGAHTTDFIPEKLRLPTKRDKILYKYGLRRAKAIAVQSNEQKDLLYDNFGLESQVIKNFYPLNPLRVPASKRKHILWVSTIRHWKRPMQFIKLAESFQHESFVMIGGRGEAKYTGLYHEVRKRANKVKNLDFLGFQPFRITEKYFDKCKVFVNTSEYEGFPNTFLQAWSRGIPVISYVDPDNVIRKQCLGVTVGSEEELHNALCSFLSSPALDSTAILNYFALNHSSGVLDQYCSWFDSIL